MRKTERFSGPTKNAGVAVYGISVDSYHANAAFARSLGLSFPLLSDWNREVSRAYGVLFAPGDLTRVRGKLPVVIIDPGSETGVQANYHWSARELASQGVHLLSTGGTCQLLRNAGLTVTEVSEHTGFPEIMDGRVKTLHPKVHGGLLGRRGQDDAVMAEHGIAPIDLLVVNLYPFEQTVDRCADWDTTIENIDG